MKDWEEEGWEEAESMFYSEYSYITNVIVSHIDCRNMHVRTSS